MRARMSFITLVGLFACVGCKTKSTDELIGDLKGGGRERIAAVRLLPRRQQDVAKIVPALIGSLKDKDADVRWSASIGLGYYGAEANGAIPALQAAEHDRDARVREGARVALSRIDPNQFPLGANKDPYKKKK
jgi:HEAT repeat protein